VIEVESNEYTTCSSKIKIRWRKSKGQKGIKEDKKRVHTKQKLNIYILCSENWDLISIFRLEMKFLFQCPCCSCFCFMKPKAGSAKVKEVKEVKKAKEVKEPTKEVKEATKEEKIEEKKDQ
jgi:hypothetical protein